MNVQTHGSKHFRLLTLTAAVTGIFGVVAPAAAFPFDTPEEWQVRWDNTVKYNLGARAKNIDDRIGNNPVFSESDYKFPDAGDIVTNRVSVLSEFDVSYRNKVGMRISASLFKDFAYDNDQVKNNPANAALGSYSTGRYSNYTKRFYKEGADLLDAFVFANFDLNDQPSSLRVGRLTQYWGNAQFFGSQGINYGQNATDGIKGLNTPGTQAKELTIPRSQVLFQTLLTPNVSFAAQYFGEFEADRGTTGGTYLGAAGFLFDGPDRLFGTVPAASSVGPKKWGFKSDYGLKIGWTPTFMDGNFGFFYRELSETKPWAPLIGLDASGNPNYHLAYADGVKLYGISYERSIGSYSTGFEASYRKNTALSSSTGPLISDLSGREGARGDTLHILANTQVGLTRSALYDTGIVVAELAYTRKLKTTRNAAMYNGVDNNAVCSTGNKWDGCATDNSASLALYVAPQWLGVFPGVDIDMPVYAQYGLYGNSATVDSANAQGSLVYTIGAHALIKQKYNLTLQFNGYRGHHSGGQTTGPAGSYYTAGTGVSFLNDRNWVALTFSTMF